MLVSMPIYAKQLSFDEAVQKIPATFANRVAPPKSPSNASRSIPSKADLLYTEKEGDLNVAYVLSGGTGEGYLVVSADDVLPAVLGYADSGEFDPATMPPAMAAWLKEYGRQLAYAIENGYDTPYASAFSQNGSVLGQNGLASLTLIGEIAKGNAANRQNAKAPERAPILPLCSAKWNQSAPFNNNCPTISGTKASTGCTATAMAQVIYAHKWPVTGTGTNTYISGTSREKLTFDFGATTFDWDNMLPSYSAGYNDKEAEAVATLMEACGNAALMSYGADASGAYPYDAIYGMVKFMGYDKSAIMTERDYYTSELWTDMVYSELANGRPVIYGGYDSSYQNGHTFIVDGYSENGFFHLNWGWGGMSDGYFLLTALDPAEQGIGGSASGYNYRQDAIINIMPAKEDSEYQLEVMWHGPFTTANKAYTAKGTVDFIVGNDGYFRGFTLESTKAVIGVKATPVEGGETVFYPGLEADFPSYYGLYQSIDYSKFSIPVSDLPTSGSYILTPAYLHNGILKDIAVKVGDVNSVLMTCSKMGVKFEDVEVARTLTADHIKVANTLYSGKSCSVTAEIHNSGEEYLGMVKAGFVNAEGEVLTWLGDVPVNLVDGESVTVLFTGILNSYNTVLEPGDYILNIFDEAGESICENPLNVTVNEAPAGKPVYDISYNLVGNDTGDGTNFSPYLIGDEVNLEVTVSVTSGLFEDVVALYGYYDDDTDATFTSSTLNYKSFFVGPNESQTLTYNLGTSQFKLNQTVYLYAYGWKSDWSAGSLGWMGRRFYVKRTENSVEGVSAAVGGVYPNPAIDYVTVTAKSTIRAISVYSLTGAEVINISNMDGGLANIGGLSNLNEESVELSVSQLQSGHYIVLVTTDKGIERHRLIKK